MIIRCIAALMAVPLLAFSQSTKEGVVVQRQDGGTFLPLPGVTVQFVPNGPGTRTNSDGRFLIAVAAGFDSIEVRHVGYTTRRYAVQDDMTRVVLDLVNVEGRAVTVEAEQSSITSAPVKTERISSRDLTKAACCSLAESFEKSPTVEVSFSDAISGARTIQLLGLRGTYTQLLTEAVPAVRGMEIPYGLDHIPGPFMESVSISKGAATVSQGYEAMTGQINVEYRKPMSSEPFYLNMYGNTLGRAEVNATSAIVLNDELGTMVMAHGRTFNGEVDQNTDGFLDMPKFRQWNLLNRWWFNNDDIEVQVLGRLLRDGYATGQMGASFDDRAPRDDRFAMRTTIDRSEVFAKVGLLDAFDAVEGSSVAIVANASWHDYSSFFGLRQYEGRQRSAQVRALTALPFRDDVSMMAGLSWQFDDVAESILDRNLNRWESVPGIFAEVTTKPFNGVTLIGGMRVDEHNMFGTFVTPRVHGKWSMTDYTTLRASAGKGYRVPTLVAENISAFITSMPPIIETDIRPEVSWNYGVSITHVMEVFGRAVTLDAELYHTEFNNQLVVDFDAVPGSVQFRNLGDGRSFATAGMVQALMSVLPGLDVNVAYRRVDNRTTFGGKLMERPMFSRDRVLVTASWALPDDSWQIDATWSYHSGGRLPSTEHLTPEHRRGDAFPGFARLNGQVQHRFSDFDVYVGIENATNFFQQDPIIAPERPFGPHFDAAMAWGPTDQRFVYLGFRFRVP